MILPKSSLLLLVSYFTILKPTTIHAWGKDGHQIVANIAYNRLSPSSRAAVDKILNITIYPYSTQTPLGVVADWADEYRQKEKWSEQLHYIDIPDETLPMGCHWEYEKEYHQQGGVMGGTRGLRGVKDGDDRHCTFVYDSDCVNDACVAGSIPNYTSILYDTTQSVWSNEDYIPSNATIDALKFVTHFIGDIHQPLHVSRQSDRGGNSITVHFAVGKYNHSSNLHKVWDSEIIDYAIETLFHGERLEMEHHLMTLIDTSYASDTEVWERECSDGRNKECTSAWAQESLLDALAWAYYGGDVMSSSGGGVGSDIVTGDSINDAYYVTRLDVVFRKLAAAAVRLSSTLNIIFDNVSVENEALDTNLGTFLRGILVAFQ